MEFGLFHQFSLCSFSAVLAEDAIKAALADYKVKQDSKTKNQD